MLSDPHNNTLRFTVVPELTGDFDGDGLLTVTDIDMLTTEVLTGDDTPRFDLDDDSLVNEQDHRIWIKELKYTWFGDVNFDLEFDSSDMVTAFVDRGYEQGPRTEVAAVPEPGGWRLFVMGLLPWLLARRVNKGCLSEVLSWPSGSKTCSSLKNQSALWPTH